MLVRKNGQKIEVSRNLSKESFKFFSETYPNWEDLSFVVYDSFSDPKKVFIDIGGWNGCTAIYASRLNRKVLSVEPDPDAIADFKTMVNDNDISNIEIIERPLYKESERVNFAPLSDKWNTSASQIKKEANDNAISMDAITFEYLLKVSGGDDVSLIKIDIEGGEQHLLDDLTRVSQSIPMYISMHLKWWENPSQIKNWEKLFTRYNSIYAAISHNTTGKDLTFQQVSKENIVEFIKKRPSTSLLLSDHKNQTFVEKQVDMLVQRLSEKTNELEKYRILLSEKTNELEKYRILSQRKEKAYKNKVIEKEKVILSMRSSKFWKARNIYIHFKKSLRQGLKNPLLVFTFLRKTCTKIRGKTVHLYLNFKTPHHTSSNAAIPENFFKVGKGAPKDTVEIVIVRFNNRAVEDRAIAAVKKHTTHPYKLTVYDNYEKNEGLSTVWNRLIKESDCKYVCLLNSDAFATTSWLEEMMKGFNVDKVAGISPSSNNAKGQICKPNETYKSTFLEMTTLSGFCLLIKSELPFEFPESVPFYGGEHAWCIEVRRHGYKLLWSQGAWVEHLEASSAKKTDNHKKLLADRNKRFYTWLASTTPVLFTTYNRLEFTKKTLPILLESTCGKVIVVDNDSTDGTREYLKSLNHDKLHVIYHKKNMGVGGAMNTFFDMTKNEEFVAKVDNDTVVPEDWLIKMVELCSIFQIDAMQAKHAVVRASGESFEEWMMTLKQRGDHVFLSDFVGGSGLLVRRRSITKNVPDVDWVLGAWSQYQKDHPGLRTAFCDNVEIELLDMNGDNNGNYDQYTDYYRETKRFK